MLVLLSKNLICWVSFVSSSATRDQHRNREKSSFPHTVGEKNIWKVTQTKLQPKVSQVCGDLTIHKLVIKSKSMIYGCTLILNSRNELPTTNSWNIVFSPFGKTGLHRDSPFLVGYFLPTLATFKAHDALCEPRYLRTDLFIHLFNFIYFNSNHRKMISVWWFNLFTKLNHP